jgi:hypothetical protein
MTLHFGKQIGCDFGRDDAISCLVRYVQRVEAQHFPGAAHFFADRNPRSGKFNAYFEDSAISSWTYSACWVAHAADVVADGKHIGDQACRRRVFECRSQTRVRRARGWRCRDRRWFHLDTVSPGCARFAVDSLRNFADAGGVTEQLIAASLSTTFVSPVTMLRQRPRGFT